MNNHGGKREGAGRKPVYARPGCKKSHYMSDQAHAWVRQNKKNIERLVHTGQSFKPVREEYP